MVDPGLSTKFVDIAAPIKIRDKSADIEACECFPSDDLDPVRKL